MENLQVALCSCPAEGQYTYSLNVIASIWCAEMERVSIMSLKGASLLDTERRVSIRRRQRLKVCDLIFLMIQT